MVSAWYCHRSSTRGLANKTQSLGKITARKRQSISRQASISLGQKGSPWPQSCRALFKRCPIITNRTEEESPTTLPLLLISLLSTTFHPAVQARKLGVIPDFSPPFTPTPPGTHCVLSTLTLSVIQIHLSPIPTNMLKRNKNIRPCTQACKHVLLTACSQ